MTAAPRRRTTARVVPVDGRGRVLLLGRDPDGPPARYWFTIGGGVEPGESLRDHDESEQILDCRWWAPEAWAAAGSVLNRDLIRFMTAAVASVEVRS